MDGEGAVRQVRRLIQRDTPRPATGIRGMLRRRAWDRLTRAGRGWPEPDRRSAAEELLGDWAKTGAPDDTPLTALLIAWAGQADFNAAVIRETQVQRWVDVPAYAEYCLRHGLAPEDPADRARFYTVTGQSERRNALDPDGSLIVAVYQGADESLRSTLRGLLGHEAETTAAAPAENGRDSGPDLMRVVTGAGARPVAELTDEERKYLGRLLPVQRNWDGLWELKRTLTPLAVIAELSGFPDDWRPADPGDRALVGALKNADPARVRRALDALTEIGVVHVQVPGAVRAGALSDDGERLAVWTHDTRPTGSRAWPEAPSPGTISVYRLPEAVLLAQHSAVIRTEASLAYAGRKLAAFTVEHRGNDDTQAWLYRCPEDGSPMDLAFEDAGDRQRGTAAMAGYDGGLVTVSLDHTLTFHDDEGRKLTTSRYERPRARGRAAEYISRKAAVVVDQASGRIVVMRDYYGVLLDGNARDADRVPTVGEFEQSVGWHRVCLQGGDFVLTSHGSGIMRWYPGGQDRRLSAFKDYSGFADLNRSDYDGIELSGAWDMVWIPASGELCCTGASWADGRGNIYYVALGPRDYQVLDGRRALTGKKAGLLFSSAAGTCYGLGGDGFADVVLGEHIAAQALGKLTDQPVAQWQPADSAAVAQATWVGGRDPRIRPLLDVLRACADYQRSADGRLPGHRAQAAETRIWSL